jgi:hypothetical protein
LILARTLWNFPGCRVRGIYILAVSLAALLPAEAFIFSVRMEKSLPL